MGKIIIEASSMTELRALFAELNASVAYPVGQTHAQGGGIVVHNRITPENPMGAPADDQDDPNEPVNAAAPDTDKNGLRWDGRIHASSKALNTDGTWRMQRGIEKKLGAPAIAQIEAELRGTPATAPAPAAAPQMPSPGMPPVAAPQMPQQSAPPVAAPQMPAPGMPVEVPQNTVFPQPSIPQEALAPAPVQQPAPPVTSGSAMPFNEFMPLLGRMMQPHPSNNHVYVDPGYLATLCQYLGVGNITEIATMPDKIGMAVDKIKADNRWWIA